MPAKLQEDERLKIFDERLKSIQEAEGRLKIAAEDVEEERRIVAESLKIVEGRMMEVEDWRFKDIVGGRSTEVQDCQHLTLEPSLLKLPKEIISWVFLGNVLVGRGVCKALSQHLQLMPVSLIPRSFLKDNIFKQDVDLQFLQAKRDECYHYVDWPQNRVSFGGPRPTLADTTMEYFKGTIKLRINVCSDESKNFSFRTTQKSTVQEPLAELQVLTYLVQSLGLKVTDLTLGFWGYPFDFQQLLSVLNQLQSDDENPVNISIMLHLTEGHPDPNYLPRPDDSSTDGTVVGDLLLYDIMKQLAKGHRTTVKVFEIRRLDHRLPGGHEDFQSVLYMAGFFQGLETFSLSLGNRRFDHASTRQLAESLSRLTKLTTLHLDSTYLSLSNEPSLLSEFCSSLSRLSKLQVLKLDNIDETDHTIEAILSAVSSTRLEVLSLCCSPELSRGQVQMSRVLGNLQNITTLRLSLCDIGDTLVRGLVDGIQAMSLLEQLDLSRNMVSDEGLECLAEVLKTLGCLVNVDLRYQKSSRRTVPAGIPGNSPGIRFITDLMAVEIQRSMSSVKWKISMLPSKQSKQRRLKRFCLVAWYECERAFGKYKQCKTCGLFSVCVRRLPPATVKALADFDWVKEFFTDHCNFCNNDKVWSWLRYALEDGVISGHPAECRMIQVEADIKSLGDKDPLVEGQGTFMIMDGHLNLINGYFLMVIMYGLANTEDPESSLAFGSLREPAVMGDLFIGCSSYCFSEEDLRSIRRVQDFGTPLTHSPIDFWMTIATSETVEYLHDLFDNVSAFVTQLVMDR